ncbi:MULTISPECIES: GNAT family N-acetyltransferase [unclassified Curtobacterium]|uniref:GNAT family N-acetyltransferase n=1 Tax=unclassified Curtobacterium TaxID=257496 RepID=UPI00135CE1FC|nr:MULTISPECIES: GNAT family N-acetyltransferase [unclassified Curtobacterium]MBF4587156.1 GNAT family N-acetyltransferase [Curtobacterium sp. VKM Ac-2887]
MDEPTALHFSADPADLDVDRVHRWLSEQSYWARGRSRATQDAIIAGSRNFGIYDSATGAQLGYARVITDGVTFGWLADVFVDPDARGRGVGIALVQGVTEAIEQLGLKRFALFTADAQALYERFGFRPLPDPEGWMMRPGPGFGADVHD